MDVKKFDGTDIRYLNSQEVKQIAGRAGRKGIYEVGYVASYGDTQEFIKEINLYYSFSKTFGLEFDEQWVYDERIKVSEDINEILVSI